MARKTGQPFKERPATPGLSEFQTIRIGISTLRLRFYGNDRETLESAGAVFAQDGAILASVNSISEDALKLQIGKLEFEPTLPKHWPYIFQQMRRMVDKFQAVTGATMHLVETFKFREWDFDCNLSALELWTYDELEAGRMLITDADPVLKKSLGWLKFVEEYANENAAAELVEEHANENAAAKRKQGGPRKLSAKSEFPMAVASTARNIQLDFPKLRGRDAINEALAKLSVRPEIKTICIARTEETGSVDSIQNHLRKMKKRK